MFIYRSKTLLSLQKEENGEKLYSEVISLKLLEYSFEITLNLVHSTQYIYILITVTEIGYNILDLFQNLYQINDFLRVKLIIICSRKHLSIFSI